MIAVGLVRVVQRDPFLFHWDGIQYALSIDEFSLQKHQPHPPGYYLYSRALKVLDTVIHDPNLSMQILNWIAIAFAAIFVFLYVRKRAGDGDPKLGQVAAFAACFLILTNPLLLFYGSISEIYPLESFFMSIMLYLLLIGAQDRKFIWIAAAILGLIGGFRPTAEFFMIPAFLFVAWKAGAKTLFISSGILLATNLTWLIPLVQSTGGVEAYWKILFDQAQRAATDSLGIKSRRWFQLAVYSFQAISLPLIIFLGLNFRSIRAASFDKVVLVLLLFPMTFFLLIHFPKAGYFILLVPLFISAAVVFIASSKPDPMKLAVFAGLACMLNLWFYFYPPFYSVDIVDIFPPRKPVKYFTYPNYKVLTRHILLQKTFIDEVNSLGERKSTIVSDFGSLPDWRFSMYYFPNAKSILLLPDGSAFVARNREFVTRLQPFRIARQQSYLLLMNEFEQFPNSRKLNQPLKASVSPLKSMNREFSINGYRFVID